MIHFTGRWRLWGPTGCAPSRCATRGPIEALRHERYRWKPARRVWIPKKNGKKRPLGITTWSDKLVAEAARLILNAYFDVQFSDHSHGFREGRGCGDALREIYHTWKGYAWIIEGDISDCFDHAS